MPPTVRRRTAPRSDGYGAAKPELSRGPVDPDEHPGGTEEFATRRQRGTSNGKPVPSSGGRGWAAYKKNASRGKRGFGNNPDEFKVTEFDEPYLIKTLDEMPLWSYCQHFLNVITEGQRSFCCGGDQCPICDLGDIPKAYAVFDIALWVPDDTSADGGSWVHKYWQASPDPANKVGAVGELLAAAKNPRTIADPDVYLQVFKAESKKKKNGKAYTEYSVAAVKERDLEDDHGAKPLYDEDWDEFEKNRFDPEQLFPANTLKELRDAAEWLDD